jgi:hypothetical protein
MKSSENLNQFDRKMLDTIREHGCQVMSVFDDKGVQPDFSYSIGFPVTVSQPEVLIYGLDRGLMHSMINETLDQCRAGLVLVDWMPVDGLLEGFRCIARSIPAHRIDAEHFGSAMWFERHRTGNDMTAAFQIVWPGAANGLYPWEEGAKLTDSQPALYEPGRLS